jgi:2-polyprenyl-3-methyl-5-hydroxy-6-metoxy-1,4-benzoquinol methylase
MAASLAVRMPTRERMDDPTLPPAELAGALDGLARLNAWARAAAGITGRILDLARQSPDRPIRVLDVASGGGDVPIRIERTVTAAGHPIDVDGCDLQPTAVEYATRAAERRNSNARFFVHDVVRDPLPGGYDVVTSSLFLHHLSNDDAVTALRRMATAGRVVLVTDLVRSRTALLQVWIACRLLTRSRVNWDDGPASVRAAFTPAEATELAKRAGWADVIVARRRPCRFLLTGRAG